jgi:RNA polymerase sigma-70 factor (ECF subfamily)
MEFTRRLRAYAGRRVARPEDVEDLVQGVLARAVERGGIEQEGLLARLMGATHNAVIDTYRHQRSLVRHELPDIATPQTPPDAIRELARCIEPMLEGLAPEDAAILRAADLDGVPQTELAAREGVPISTIKSRVQRARRRLERAFHACCRFETDGRGRTVDWRERDPGAGTCTGGCEDPVPPSPHRTRDAPPRDATTPDGLPTGG